MLPRLILSGCWTIALAFSAPAAAQTPASAALWEALRSADLTLATVGYRLSAAATPLCDRREPGTGLQLLGLAEYEGRPRAEVSAHFRFAGNVVVEGVVPDSPAARAGVQADDTLVAINGETVPPAPQNADRTYMEALDRRIAALPPTAPIALHLVRAGKRVMLEIKPVSICRSRYQLRVADEFSARATGELVQITSKHLEDLPLDLLPVTIAHELAHNILRHADRLKAVGAEFGMASGFGSNVGLFRRTEIEADILAVHLLARAGYPPQLAARFWREAGPRLLEGKFRSRSHPPVRDRIALAETEAAKFARPGELPPLPAFYAARHKPIDRNWQQLLP